MIRSIYFRINFIIKKFYIKEVIEKNRLGEIRKIWDNLHKTSFEDFNYNLLSIQNIDKSLNQYIKQFLLRLKFIILLIKWVIFLLVGYIHLKSIGL